MPRSASIRSPHQRRHLLSLLLSFPLVACSSDPGEHVEVDHSSSNWESSGSAIIVDGLSDHSLAVLRTLDLLEVWEDDPQAVHVELGRSEGGVQEWERAMALAEVSHYIAHEVHGDSEKSRPWYLRSILEISGTVRVLSQTGAGIDPRHRLLLALYNHSLARLLSLTLECEKHPCAWKSLPDLEGRRPLRIVSDEEGCRDPGYFRAFVAADDVDFESLLNRHLQYGIGVPLVGVRDNTNPGGRKELEYGPRILAPITAVLRRGGGEELELLFVDPNRVEMLTLADGSRIPLAADRSAPLAYAFSTSNVRRLETRGLLKPAELLPLAGLYCAEPYDPERIPLVLVHGLWSSPLVWRDVVNELWNDRDLRRCYQVWYYAYPSGLPIALNAFGLRCALIETRARLDPEGDDPASQGVVLVGHSMGGLLAKMMVKRSGMHLWDYSFKVPPEALKAEEQYRDGIRDALIFEPLPFVKRVVYMAVPHRGSHMAESAVGNFGSSRITLPRNLVAAVERIVADNPDALRLHAGEEPKLCTSIDQLSPDSALLKLIEELPYAPGVPYHSIIGDRSGKGGGPGTSDGVVPWESAVQAGACSERVVKSDHGVPRDPAALLELRRILRLHLSER